MKKHIVGSLLICMAAFFFAGCVGPRDFKHTSAKFPEIPPGEGRIYFFRANDFVGGVEKEVVRLNGDVVGYVSAISFFYQDEAPGDYSVYAQGTGLFGRAIGGHETKFTLAAGETKYILFTQKVTATGVVLGGVLAGSSPTPVLEDPDSAMKVLHKCLYYPGKNHTL